jgi:predicted PP-loop superfamily ATPase
MNRRGNVAYAILVVVALAAAIVGIIVILSFDSGSSKLSGNFAQLSFEIGFNQAYQQKTAQLVLDESLTSCGNCDLGLLKETIKIKAKAVEREDERYGNLFALIRTGEFNLEESKGIVTLTIEHVFTSSKVDESSIKRDYTLVVVGKRAAKSA